MAPHADHATRSHLVHSHAHEEIPGTVDMKTREGDDTAYGLALFPVPAQDPNDPLQWSPLKKNIILLTVALYSFLSCTSLLGPSVYITLWSEVFDITPTTASGLISYPNLAYGFGTLFLIPLYHKIGRRPVMLLSLVIYAFGLLACTQAKSFSVLMFARVLHAFGSSVCEALPAQVVNDIFFLHERGKRLGFYTVALCLGSTGPLYAGYMLAGGLSWRLFFWVEFAFSLALLILAFFFVEESMYKRPKPRSAVLQSTEVDDKGANVGEAIEKSSSNTPSEEIPARKSYGETLKLWGKVDRESDFFLMMIRSFTYFIVPPVFWVATTYGLYIGLAGLVVNYTFPAKIITPPYNWPETNSGLICVASAIGYAIAMPFVTTSDQVAAYFTRKNNGIREAEFRLSILILPCFVAPAGLLLYGYAMANNLPWVAFFFGVGMVQWSAYFYFTLSLAYAIDSYNANVPEMLIAMNLGKQSISFGLGFYVLDWVLKDGYKTLICGIFTSVLLLNNLAVFGFMFGGKSMRIWFADTWLARMHKRSIKEVMTH